MRGQAPASLAFTEFSDTYRHRWVSNTPPTIQMQRRISEAPASAREQHVRGDRLSCSRASCLNAIGPAQAHIAAVCCATASTVGPHRRHGRAGRAVRVLLSSGLWPGHCKQRQYSSSVTGGRHAVQHLRTSLDTVQWDLARRLGRCIPQLQGPHADLDTSAYRSPRLQYVSRPCSKVTVELSERQPPSKSHCAAWTQNVPATKTHVQLRNCCKPDCDSSWLAVVVR
jgi:hypothetical protein